MPAGAGNGVSVVLTVVLTAGVSLGLVGPGSTSGGGILGRIPTATPYDGTPPVGALFASTTATSHFCTASVVDSPHGDMVVTAAHCIRGRGAGLTFVPEYHDGERPFGTWTVTAAFGADAWIEAQSPQADVAFLLVKPRTIDGRPTEIEAVTGGHSLGDAPAAGTTVTVPAYAAGRDDRPFTCDATVYRVGAYPAFNCHSYPGGTSGAPWLRGDAITGVIGGLHQGGCTVVTSYTSAFGRSAAATYDRAERGTDPDTFPQAGGDGC